MYLYYFCTCSFLKKKGIQSPRINAELLLAYVLKCKRLQLYLSFDRPLTQSEIDSYRDLIKRRSRFEPLQYIIGIVEFYKLEFLKKCLEFVSPSFERFLQFHFNCN